MGAQENLNRMAVGGLSVYNPAGGTSLTLTISGDLEARLQELAKRSGSDPAKVAEYL